MSKLRKRDYAAIIVAILTLVSAVGAEDATISQVVIGVVINVAIVYGIVAFYNYVKRNRSSSGS